MKKYTNKLFEWLGYVPAWYKSRLEEIEAIKDDIFKGNVHYAVERLPFEYIVYASNGNGLMRLIKNFPYTMPDSDSQDYARICAEKLCEMLNEKY